MVMRAAALYVVMIVVLSSRANHVVILVHIDLPMVMVVMHDVRAVIAIHVCDAVALVRLGRGSAKSESHSDRKNGSEKFHDVFGC